MSDPTNPRFLSQPDPEPMTQLRAALALVALIQEDAPAVQWRLDDNGRYLRGQLFGPQGSRRPAMAAWQRVIGAGPVESNQSGHDEHLSISGSYEGIPVDVVTIVDAEKVLADRLSRAADALGEGQHLTAEDLRALIAESGDAA